MSEAAFTLLNLTVARFRPRDDVSASAKWGYAARTRTLHAKGQIRFATVLLWKRRTFLGISADGISVVSLFNQGPASVINFGELFSISNHLLKVSPVVVYCGRNR